MPNTSRSPTKRIGQDSAKKLENSLNRSGSSSRSSCRSRARKRKLCEIAGSTEDELESELEDCNMEDAIAIEKKLRKIARSNALSDEEMRMLLQKFVKNEHILALVTLKAEDELAREQREAEKRAIIITDTPSVPKLTRSKAKELNRAPAIALPKLADSGSKEIASLIVEELHSDEDDEEYTFQEEDFISDDDPNTTISDMDSNPRTPCTPMTQTEFEDSPVKFSADGCFKVPFDKQADLRIATRTRSKFCLQQTTIEDLQSEFVPPDVEHSDGQDAIELTANDEDWMQFLNDFSKPLNNSFMGDDDDPVNDPEYVAAEKVTVDAEELRDVNISKKELTELVAELFEGLLNEGVSLESIELETPQKFVQNNSIIDKPQTPATPTTPANTTAPALPVAQKEIVARQIDFDAQQETPQRLLMTAPNSQPLQHCVSDATISSTNLLQAECAFQPNVMSTPSSSTQPERIVPIANIPDHHVASQMITLPEAALRTEPELIAVRVPGQPNCFKLAKVVSSAEDTDKNQITSDVDTRYTQQYDTNYTFKYISIRKHIYSEYMQKFENLKNSNVGEEEELSLDSESVEAGFTKHQHDLLQQQLRIHVQLLAQNFLQTYCHPDLWEFAHKPFKMLQELKEHAKDDASFNAWNLNAAYDLVTQWKERCNVDNAENREMMKFLNKEVRRTSRKTRQVARFPPLIMEQVVNSTVFMYPQYLPRLLFTLRRKDNRYEIFAPAESLLIAMGLEKYLKNGKPVRNKPPTLASACDHISNDMIMGKTARRIWDRIKTLRLADYNNPVKYFFEHGCSPPVECKLYTFPNNTVLPPKEREAELPMVWQKYVSEKKAKEQLHSPESTTSPKLRASLAASESYLEFVREAVGDEVFLPDSLTAAAEPEQNGRTATPTTTPTITITNGDKATSKQSKKRSKANNKKDERNNKQQTVTINVNYVFGADTATSFLNKSNASNTSSVPALLDASTARDSILANERNSTLSSSVLASSTTIQDITTTTTKRSGGGEQPPIIAYNYDIANNIWQPLIATTPQAKSSTPLSKSSTSLAKSPSQQADSRQRKLTDFFAVKQVVGKHSAWEDIQNKENFAFDIEKKRCSPKLKTRRFKARSAFNLSKQFHKAALKHRQTQNRRRRYAALLTNYRLQLQQQLQLYKSKPVLKYFHRHFRALELYSDLLCGLKMSCKNLVAAANGAGATAAAASTGGGSPLVLGKRPRNLTSLPSALDDDINGGRIRKINRQEENFRNMLLPDSAEDSNRKDAIYAFNFYEKVEEVFKSSSRPEDCKRFNYILKSFDPKRDKVSELYYKLERLFLPEFPELAQVFLTFLLPSEAAEIGKFFEHFMAENVKTFINKLNIYFHKQPAQLRKVFNCLSELAEEENVTIKTVEARILPLLRGNKFLEDWFMQLFPEVPPPERLLPAPEHVNLKETQNNQSGEFLEHVMNLLDSPTTEQQQQQQQQQSQCQLRYINGRIFYGSKITLPAKLSFMAQKFAEEGNVGGNSEEDEDVFVSNNDSCIHAIRDYGEKRIQAATVAAAVAATTAAADCSSSEDNERTEEDEASKSLVIDSAGEDDSVCSNTYETCDDATLRAHAVRLNPNYYSNGWQNTSTSNAQQAGQTPQSNVTPGGSAKRAASNLSDDVKLSPRKQATAAAAAAVVTTATNGQNNSTTNSTTAASNSSLTQAQREKRKSPVKKIGSAAGSNINNSKTSPINKQRAFNAQPPMVVIHEQNSAIACAKKLKSLIDYSSESDADTKTGIPIVARAKHAKAAENSADNLSAAEVKIEENSDDMEFLPESAEITTTLPHSSLESVKMDDDSMQEPVVAITTTITSKPAAEEQNVVSSSNMESDEDVKLDIVATLTTAANEEETATTATNCSSITTTATNCSSTCLTSSMTTTKSIDLTQKPQHSIGHLTHLPAAWTRNEDKIILIEMKLGSRNRDDLFQRIKAKLPERSILEIAGRHQFLIEFLSKLQGH